MQTAKTRCATDTVSGGVPPGKEPFRGKAWKFWDSLHVAGLCIGVREYKYAGNLRNAVSDAEAFSAKLKAVAGCNSEVVRNPKTATALRKSVTKCLEEKGLHSTPPKLFVLFYAGHGIQEGNKVYLVPGDADTREGVDCHRECLPLDDLLKSLRDTLDRPVREKVGADQATVFLVMLDCCRIQLNRSFGDALACEPAPGSAPLKYTILFSCSRTQTASDGPSGGCSPFLQALLDEQHGFFAEGVTLHTAIHQVASALDSNKNQDCISVKLEAIPQHFCIWPKVGAEGGGGLLGAERTRERGRWMRTCGRSCKSGRYRMRLKFSPHMAFALCRI